MTFPTRGQQGHQLHTSSCLHTLGHIVHSLSQVHAMIPGHRVFCHATIRLGRGYVVQSTCLPASVVACALHQLESVW